MQPITNGSFGMVVPDTLWAQALSALEGEAEQAGTRLQYAHLIHQHYAGDYETVFGSTSGA